MNENMNEKVADNRISKTEQTLQDIKEVDRRIESSYDTLKSIDEMEDAFNSLNKNMNTLIDLLDKSVKGPKVTQQLDEMRLSNQSIYKSSIYDIDENRSSTIQEINEFENIKEEYRKRLKEEEEEERRDSSSESSENPQEY